MNQSLQCDVAVLGTGVIGSTIAWEATRAGLKVVRLGRVRSGAATHAAGGMLTPSFEAEGVEQSLIDLAVESCRTYPAFTETLEESAGQLSGYSPSGSLLLAVSPDHLSELSHLEKFQTSLGLQADRPTIRELREIEPNLSPRLAGGLYARDEHHINPRQFQKCLELGLERCGVPRIELVAQPELKIRSGRVVGVLAQTENSRDVHIEADHIVASDGVWTSELTPLRDRLHLRPIKGQYLRVRGEHLIHRTIRTPDVYMVPRADGEIYIGATSEEVGFDASVRAGAAMDLLWQAWRVLPGIYELELIEAGVGFRPALRDNLPLIDEGPLEGLIVATGHYRHGIMLAPITALGVLEIIQGKGVPDIFKSFGWDRFAAQLGT